MSDSKTIVVDQNEHEVLELKARRYDEGQLPDDRVAIGREELQELRHKAEQFDLQQRLPANQVLIDRERLLELRFAAAQYEDNRIGKRTMNDLNAAYRVGWVAGYGLAVAAHIEEKDNVGTPLCNVHTSWANYVPNWVDVANLGEHWKKGWDAGLAFGKLVEEVR